MSTVANAIALAMAPPEPCPVAQLKSPLQPSKHRPMPPPSQPSDDQHQEQQQQHDVTQLLLRVEEGDREAVDLLMPAVYRELRRLAAGYLQRERGSHTLQPTALVHEAYMRLVDQSRVQWQNRAHFFGVAAQMMRRVLVDHARTQGARKRGGDLNKLQLEDGLVAGISRDADLVAVDDALRALAENDPIKAKIVELRFFGGLSIEETAEAVGVSSATVNRHWRMAKAWLYGELNRRPTA